MLKDIYLVLLAEIFTVSPALVTSMFRLVAYLSVFQIRTKDTLFFKVIKNKYIFKKRLQIKTLEKLIWFLKLQMPIHKF